MAGTSGKYRIRVPRLRGKTPCAVVGMDLGTTNSVVARAEYDGAGRLRMRVLRVEQETPDGTERDKLLPSAVAACAGRTWVGRGALCVRARGAAPGQEALREKRELFFECKNDMGTNRTYHHAPEELRTPARVSSLVLGLLKATAELGDGALPTRSVVTVPASFQSPQREDTLAAARLAGVKLTAGDLLDEPVAAFIDYVFRHGQSLPIFERPRINLLVFDFGGGTCDTAVLRLDLEEPDRLPRVTPLAVSRYHRLGGGDIDRAIVHEVLIPELARQNGIDARDLDFEARKEFLEPALLDLAEQLKVRLCEAMQGRGADGSDKRARNARALEVRLPGTRAVRDGNVILSLENPALDRNTFQRLLAPFLDRDLLYARETEYRLTGSIFGPVQDCLERAGLRARQVDLCLAVGGSARIPQVLAALRRFLPRAEVLACRRPQEAQYAAARGAAYHAAYRELTGRSLVPFVCHDTVTLATCGARMELVPAGSELPWPEAGRRGYCAHLCVPENIAAARYRLRVEVVAGRERRYVRSQVWQLDERVSPGQPLALRYHMDANQCLHLELSLPKTSVAPFGMTVDNPLTNVVNPGRVRLRLREKEEVVGAKEARGEVEIRDYVELAELHHEVGQHDKARGLLTRGMRLLDAPGPWILERMAVYAAAGGDDERACKLYREAARLDREQGTSLFNLALQHQRKGRSQQALQAARAACERERRPEYLCLLATILFDRRQEKEAQRVLTEGRALFPALARLSDWSLGWYISAAGLADDEVELEAAMREREERTRKRKERVRLEAEGALPVLTRRESQPVS